MIPEWIGRLWVLLVLLSALFWTFVFGVPNLGKPDMMSALIGASVLPPTVLVVVLVLLSWIGRAILPGRR